MHDHIHEIPILCSLCTFNGHNKESLDRHMKNAHTVWTCDLCDYQTTGERILSYHERTVHVENTHACLKCNIRFPSQESYNRHYENHQAMRRVYTHEERVHNGYCSFWNNTNCNFGDQCKFLHENAPFCRFQSRCYRKKCPFYHEEGRSSSSFLHPMTNLYH